MPALQDCGSGAPVGGGGVEQEKPVSAVQCDLRLYPTINHIHICVLPFCFQVHHPQRILFTP